MVLVCFVDFFEGRLRDVSSTSRVAEHHHQIGVRGMCNIYAANVEDFVAQCKDANLEWIVPAKEQ